MAHYGHNTSISLRLPVNPFRKSLNGTPELHMEHQPTYVEIDVAKDWVDVAVRPAGCVWRVNYEEAEVAALVVQLQALQPTAVILEVHGRTGDAPDGCPGRCCAARGGDQPSAGT